MTPDPSSISQNWCCWMPSAEISIPPHQHTAATTPALRGPARSSQPPQTAAAMPRIRKNSVNIQPRVEMCQSQLLANHSPKKPTSGPQVLPAPALDNCLESGSQNTEKPYAMPMHRWIASAAGGTIQRLNPAPAMMRSLSSSPGACAPRSGPARPLSPRTLDILLFLQLDVARPLHPGARRVFSVGTPTSN